eukprot:2253448-Pyramimonas_sp.AAC.1
MPVVNSAEFLLPPNELHPRTTPVVCAEERGAFRLGPFDAQPTLVCPMCQFVVDGMVRRVVGRHCSPEVVVEGVGGF